jgi:PAS domain S-box-containing protein
MTQHQETVPSRRRAVSYWLTALGLILAFTVFRGVEWRGSTELHTHMELIATLLAMVVGAMALVRFYSKKDNTFLFIGVGFLGTAFLDGYHTVVTSEFFQPFMPSDMPSLIPWSWVASRQFLSIMIFMSWFYWFRSQRIADNGSISEKKVYIFTGLFTLASFAFFAFAPLPPAYYPDIIFHRPEEFGPALFFLMALIGYLKKGLWRSDAFEHWLVLSLIVGFIGQAVFMSLSGMLFDYEFDAAHLLKKVSYVFVLIGLMFNMFAIFRQADDSEARFRGAIESLQESFALYDADDRLVIYNQEFLRLHSNVQDIIKPGITYESLLKANVKRGDVPVAKGREEEFIRERIAQHLNPQELILRETADGSWFLINESKTRDGGIAVTQTDITELKNAELALRESEARMKAIIDTVPALINLKDTNNRYLMVNRHHSEFFGIDSKKLIGRTSTEISIEHDEKIQTINQSVIETGEAVAPYDYKMTDARGRKRVLLTTKAPLKDINGVAIGVVSTSIDITERKQAEDALHESEARTRAIVDNAIDGIITIDERGTIHSINPAAEVIFGYSEEELIGQNISKLAAEPYRSAHDRYLANYITTNEAKIIGLGREVEGERANGEHFPMDLAVSEVILDDERMFIGIVRDITERKEMDRMKSEFVSNVSHELRTPLTSIRGSLGLVTGGAVGDVPEKAQAMIRMAEQNTDRLINLVNDILDMEKLESGSMEFQFDVIDLLDLVRSEIEANQGYAEQYEVKFILATSDPDLVVRGDRDRLNQVMANLLSNAAKFSPTGGEIEIAAIRHNGVARVSVSDFGPGIPDEFQEDIFEKFTQVDSSDTRQVGGTGLGLNISKTIIEKHGGNIGFEPNQEQGTVFYFDLPLLD